MSEEEVKENPQNSENQEDGESGESLILGKYKTQEEAFAALEEAEREKNSLKEALDREQRLNQLLDSVKDEPQYQEPQASSDYDESELYDVFGDEDQVKKFNRTLEAREQEIFRRVNSLVDSKVQQIEARRNATKQFYSKYPELEGFEDRVDFHASNLGRELGPRASKVQFDKLAEEVASRVKSELAETKKKLTKSSLYVEGGGVSEPNVNVQSSSKPESVSEEERAARYFDEEVKAFNKKKDAPFIVGR